MCGIVGYVGPRETARVLIEGLRRLEYRGYDSAGIAVFHQGRVEIRRKEGKLNRLEEALGAERFAEWVTSAREEPFEETAYTSDLLRNRMLNELFAENVPVILHEDDLNAMYFSIENRSPFLDRDLCEFAYSIPTRHLIRAGRAKAVLREAMRGIVPDKILDNPRKVGFNAPIFSFLDVKQADVRRELLAASPIYDVVRKPAIQRLLDEPSLANSESKFLFSFLVSKMFLEEFA